MKSERTKVPRYIAFCLIASGLNIGFQFGAREVMGWAVSVSVALGTLVGLFSKYVLDRNYIFDSRGVGLSKDVGRFILYAASGLMTTGLFLGVEWLFITKVSHPYSQYMGAVLGLGLGYTIKYAFDQSVTFNKSAFL